VADKAADLVREVFIFRAVLHGHARRLREKGRGVSGLKRKQAGKTSWFVEYLNSRGNPKLTPALRILIFQTLTETKQRLGQYEFDNSITRMETALEMMRLVSADKPLPIG
jgi:methyl coenzyme M reductase gamma subunit